MLVEMMICKFMKLNFFILNFSNLLDRVGGGFYYRTEKNFKLILEMAYLLITFTSVSLFNPQRTNEM